MSADELRVARAKVLEQCRAELHALLERYGCDVVAIPFIDGEGRIRARVELTTK